MNPLGFVLPAASIGLGALLIRPQRGFFPFNDEGEALAPLTPQVTLEERHLDELEITEHPIEQGAAIADHAFKRPSEVIIRCAWSNSPSASGGLIGTAVGIGAAIGGPRFGVLASLPSTIKAAQSLLTGNSEDQAKAIYKKLLSLQTDRIPFDVYTGKRVYRNMLLRSLSVTTDQHSENALAVVAVCREVIIVSTRPFVVPLSQQKEPEKTGGLSQFGPKSLIPAPTFTVPSFLK